MTRPRSLPSQTVRTRTAHGTIYLTVTYHDDQPREVFIAQGKAGSCEAAQNEALARVIALALNHGAGLVEVAKQLHGLSCCPYIGERGNASPADAIASALMLADAPAKDGDSAD